MNFFKKIKASIYDRAFYKSLNEKTVSQSVVYILSLVFLLTLIYVGILSIVVIPLIHEAKDFVLNKSHTYYPDELVVTVKDNTVSTNVKEPYFIKTQPTNNTLPRNLVVIDTKSTFSEKLFRDYNTPILLTKDSVVTFEKNKVDFDKEGKPFLDNKNSSVMITKIEGIATTTTITKANVTKAINYIGSKMGFITPIGLTLVLLVLWIVNTVLALLLSIVGAFVVWIIEAQVFKNETNFDHSYKKALHLGTTIILISTLNMITTFTIPAIVYLVIFITLAYINLAPGKKHVHHHTHTEHKNHQS